MTVELTLVEEAALELNKQGEESVEDVLHRFLLPLVEDVGEKRLGLLSDIYRSMSPADQFEAIELLRRWRAAKTEPTPTPTSR